MNLVSIILLSIVVIAFVMVAHSYIRGNHGRKSCCDTGDENGNIPDPDLIIRTSGEERLSNFLLWQLAYTEFYCTDVLWPDFNRYEFLRALLAYQARDRRFGAV